ncbi:MAG TPA: hypothetical protein VGL00_17315 [Terracidiphilus sp.]|jgi:hypothetical protein
MAVPGLIGSEEAVGLELVRMSIDDCITHILGEAGFPESHQHKFRRTRDALAISLLDLARSPRNKTGHLHLARVKGRRIVLQKAHWDALAASVSFLKSLREAHVPPLAVHENSLVVTIARTCRAIHALDEYQLGVLTAVMRIVEAQLRMKAETPGASPEEIALYLSEKGVEASADLDSSLDDLTPAILQRASRHPGQRRFTAAY